MNFTRSTRLLHLLEARDNAQAFLESGRSDHELRALQGLFGHRRELVTATKALSEAIDMLSEAEGHKPATALPISRIGST